VSETGRCPHCGSPAGGASEPDGGRELAGAAEAGARASGVEPLYREVRRIREIAEARASDDDARRIAELTRQVAELRATVARLRGVGASGLVAAGHRA
jgi:hypothetical protein